MNKSSVLDQNNVDNNSGEQHSNKQSTLQALAPLKNNIESLLQIDLKHAQRLVEVLQLERSCLKKRDPETLAALIEEKNQLLEKLNQSAQIRSQWLNQLGYDTSLKAWEDVIEQQKDEALSLLWGQLQQSISTGQELNEINGRLIGRSQQTLLKLLSILRGNNSAPQLYGSDGNTQNNSESQCFTEA